ncbi:hypothetical protein WAF17_10040 [Bernardetia sp. ABR2-2B]|uniref:hypothetical protein n=1 Tax=Bernardetia sp. ABR2-2B TaxID=3127472 RepID=UPI0030CA6A7F
MKDILISSKTHTLKLTFAEAFHPSKLNIRADHWYFTYKLRLLDDSLEFGKWFTGRFWKLTDDIIVFEEYTNKNLDEESIKYDSDVSLRLFLIDFQKNATARFSHFQGGQFDIIELTEDGRIVFQKKAYSQTREFEINLDDLKFESFDKI